MTVNTKKNPLKTRNDKTKLGPLSLSQLIDLKSKSLKNKEKAKIQRRINNLLKLKR
jgi:hypothetical protein